MSHVVENHQLDVLTTAHEIADHHSCNALFNCYIRECVLPQNHLQVSCLANNTVMLGLYLGSYHLSAKVTKESLSGFFSLVSAISATDSLGSHSTLDYFSLLSLINHQLSQEKKLPLNIELLLQAKSSLQNMSYFIAKDTKIPKRSFIGSEQSLLFGHEFHPTPKARYGINETLMRTLSPETSARFKLHYFRVPKSLVHNFSSEAYLPTLFKEAYDFIDYPLHPWQAQYLLNDPARTQLLNDLAIRSIGIMGKEVMATSSVRTLFSTEDNYMYKFSLHMRLTNCLRKNAIYELESAVHLSQLLKKQALTTDHPRVRLLHEPNAYTLALDNTPKHIELKEIFGVILRENIEPKEQQNTYVALKLFSAQVFSKPLICQILDELSQSQSTYQEVAKAWFKDYCQILIPFVLENFCQKGIVFEPHLQNVVVHLDQDNHVSHLYIRDLEGTKLCCHHWQNNRQAPLIKGVFYDVEQSFRRVAYCLVFNHLASAIHYMAQNSFTLEKSLWEIVVRQVKALSEKHANVPFSQQQLRRLLTSKHLPYKANLLTRFLKSADKNATYIDLINPLLMSNSYV